MARSWERMVQRNTQNINKQRKKQGKDVLYATKSPAKNVDVFKGRNIVFPVVLLALGVMFWVVGTIDSQKSEGLLANWLGVILYFVLAALIYFRRPYLKVDRSKLSTSKFNRERFLPAGEIEIITLSRGAVSIKHKGKRTRWVFSRLINRYDTSVMGERLEQFAKVNNIVIEHE